VTVKGILEVPGSLEGDDDLDLRESIDHHLDLQLVSFAKKYDMKSILDAIKPHLFGLVISFPPAKVRLVLVAAASGQGGLCRRLVITGNISLNYWSEPSPSLVDYNAWTMNTDT
jgi:hypothetical protein